MPRRMTITPSTMDKDDEIRQPRSMVFSKMEKIIRDMQQSDTGVPVRMQKMFLTTIPCAFTGYDLTEWLAEKMDIEDNEECQHLASLLCQYGYYFPVVDTKNLNVKEDSTLFRFQSPYFWPSQNWEPDNVDYAIYLTKRSMRNKQKHGLDDYEQVSFLKLQKMLSDKLDFVLMQAEEQVRLAKERKKADKVVLDSQERAFWRVHRPPPGHVKCLEEGVPKNNQLSKILSKKRRTVEGYKKEIAFLQRSVAHMRMKTSKAAEGIMHRCEQYQEHDPFLSQPQPSNPWISDDISYWQYNSSESPAATTRQVRRWGFDIHEVLNDPKGRKEFELFLQKEFSFENLQFWTDCEELKNETPLKFVPERARAIYKEFLAPGAPSEINIDSKTMDVTMKRLKNPTRFTYDAAQDHIFLLMKKDSYSRFLRSEHYKNLLATAVNPSSKKKFFNFGTNKKKSPQPSPKPTRRRGSANSEAQSEENASLSLHAISHHSFSTGNLKDLVQPDKDKSNKSTPFGSAGDLKNNSPEGKSGRVSPQSLSMKLEVLIRSESPNTRNLEVPNYTGLQNYTGLPASSDELHMKHIEDEMSVNIAVPNAKTNVVAPWEDVEDSPANVVAPWEDNDMPSKGNVVAPWENEDNQSAKGNAVAPWEESSSRVNCVAPWEDQEVPKSTKSHVEVQRLG